MRLDVSAGAVNSSWDGADGRGPVGEASQAPTNKEAIATRTNVRWRRDMGDSGEGANGWCRLLSRT
jgi:hypothetical protein